MLAPYLYTCLYTCPVCQTRLLEEGKSLKCANNHSFDRHKKGYINLLLAQHKSSKAPGDNTEMVNGRRAFLRAGHYQPMANALCDLLKEHLLKKPPIEGQVEDQNIDATDINILDAGCGEGYYTEQIQAALPHSQVYGLDISKPAIHAAANNKEVQWSVASSNRLPFADASLDAVVSVFSRIEIEEFARVLKPDGYIAFVGPGDNHLQQLRTIIYDEVRDYSTDKHQDYFSHNFCCINEQELTVPLQLNNLEEISQLLDMTPHAHRVSASGRERLQQTQHLIDEGNFKIYLYQKKRADE